MLKRCGRTSQEFAAREKSFTVELIKWAMDNMSSNRVAIRYIADKNKGSFKDDRIEISVGKAMFQFAPKKQNAGRLPLTLLFMAHIYKKLTGIGMRGGKFDLFSGINISDVICGGMAEAVKEDLYELLDRDPEDWNLQEAVCLSKLLSLAGSTEGEKKDLLGKAVSFLFDEGERQDEKFRKRYAPMEEIFNEI